MKFKRIIAIMLLFLSFSILLTSCRKEDKIKVKTEKTKFVNYSADYDMPSTSLYTYYINDSETRYVDAAGFFRNLKGFYMTQYFRISSLMFSDSLSIFVNVLTTSGKVKKVSAKFDWENDTITISDPLFFNVINISQTTNYSRLLNETEGESTEVSPAVFNLSDFGFEIYVKNGKVFVPFSIMNTIFCSGDYYNIYYDGDKYFGVTYDISFYKEMQELKTCKLNDKEQTIELREETYNHLKFVMYYYYGLKEYKGITDIDEELKDYKEGFLSLDPVVNKNTYFDYFVKHLDELHTRIGAHSFYYDPTDNNTNNWNLDVTSDARIQYKAVEEELKTISSGYYDGKNTYMVNGDTCMITLASFTTGSDEQVASDEAYKYDTFEYIKYVLDGLNGNVRNVIIDVAQNGGGNVGALIRSLGFLSNDSINYYSYNYLFDSATCSLMDVDVDKDDDFTDDDAYTQFNWYVLSSYNTFSAANSFTAMAKSLGATIIGQKTGGGMCSVLPIVLADQTSIEMSSHDAQMALIDGKYEFIEGGVEPDIYIDYNKFYDLDYIKTLLV